MAAKGIKSAVAFFDPRCDIQTFGSVQGAEYRESVVPDFRFKLLSHSADVGQEIKIFFS
jgi:hypothetical protein